jgi:hypothetical protein
MPTASQSAGSRPPATDPKDDAPRRAPRLDLDPARSSEAAKRRPAVIVSNDHANQTAQSLGRKVLTVVPIASDIDRLYPFRVLLAPAPPGSRSRQRPEPNRSAPSRSAVSANQSAKRRRRSSRRSTRRCGYTWRSGLPRRSVLRDGGLRGEIDSDETIVKLLRRASGRSVRNNSMPSRGLRVPDRFVGQACVAG